MAPAAFGTWDTGELLLIQAKLPSEAPVAAGRLLSRSTVRSIVRSVTPDLIRLSLCNSQSGRRTFRLREDSACAQSEEHRQHVAIYPVRYFTTRTSYRVKRDKDSVRSFRIPTEAATCNLGLWTLDFRFWKNDIGFALHSHPVFWLSTLLSFGENPRRNTSAPTSLNCLAQAIRRSENLFTPTLLDQPS